MAANPFLSLFSTEEDAEAAVQAKERQNHQMSQIITRVLLVRGGIDLKVLICHLVLTLGNDQFVDDKLKYFLLLSEENVLTFDNYEKVCSLTVTMKYVTLPPCFTNH